MAKVKYYELKDIKFVEKSSHWRFLDIEGRRFNKLLVIGYAGTDKNFNAMWFCQCDCGKIVKKQGSSIRYESFSCGCVTKEGILFERQGMSDTVEYSTYRRAKNRCRHKNNASYERYGKRGIKFLFTSFEEFFEDVGLRPSNEYSLDRINNDGNYEKGNVRWATIKEQCANRHNSIIIEHNGEKLSIPDWAKKTGIGKGVIYRRYTRGVREPELLFAKSRNHTRTVNK